jgi:hypothetical protein
MANGQVTGTLESVVVTGMRFYRLRKGRRESAVERRIRRGEGGGEKPHGGIHVGQARVNGFATLGYARRIDASSNA